jgi:protein Cut8
MNSVLQNDPLSAPHLLVNRLSPSRSGTSHQHTHTTAFIGGKNVANQYHAFVDPFNLASMSGRKRKASEEPDNDRMSTSPSASPSVSNRALPSSSTHRSIKRTRTGNAIGRPLPLPRLLQTLSADEMRQLLQNVCEQHPELQQEIVTKAPRPSIESTLSVLSKYEDDFRKAFPLGNRPTSDYAYNRVRQHLTQLIEALRDFTPHFLPPQEPQTALSFNYLDAATNMIHRLPDFDTFQHQRYKNDAYDELSKAWALVIREAAKRAGGFHLQLGGWDQKLMEHNQRSGGKLAEAVNELNTGLGFMQAGMGQPSAAGVSDERMSIRQQLFSGSFGQQLGVGPGGW